VEGPDVNFEPLASLAVGADAVFRVRVRYQQEGDWRFQVRLTSDDSGVPVCREESTRVYR
jgi:hypothetical protein